MNTSTIVTAVGVILGAIGFSTDQSRAVQSVVAAGVALIIAVHTAVKAIERHKRNVTAVDAIHAKAELTHWQVVRNAQTTHAATLAAPIDPDPFLLAAPKAAPTPPTPPSPPPAPGPVNADGSAIPYTGPTS